MNVQLFLPTFAIEECLAEIRECLERGWTGLGYKTLDFEKAWCDYTGLPHAHFLNSATSGLHLAVNILKETEHWEEGDEIKFYAYGGVAGIKKGLVSKVTTSNVTYKEDSSSKGDLEKGKAPTVLSGPNEKESAQSRGSETASRADGSGKKSESKGEAVDFDYYRERKASLREKLEDALQRNRDATTRQDQDARESTRQEYLKFSKQIMDLGEELKKKNKGVLPDWWDE